jgi:hypothetical protein
MQRFPVLRGTFVNHSRVTNVLSFPTSAAWRGRFPVTRHGVRGELIDDP